MFSRSAGNDYIYGLKKINLSMLSWNPYPFFRLIVPFVAGILVSVYTDVPVESARIPLMVVTLLFFLPVVLVYFLGSWHLRWLSGTAISIFFFVAGYTFTAIHTPKYDPQNISNQDADGGSWLVRITEPLAEKPNSYKTTGKFIGAVDTSGLKKVTGKLLIYFEKDTLAQHLKYGDEILISGSVSEIAPPGNPHQFDYKRFLGNSGIYHQVYLRYGTWQKTNVHWKNPVFDFAYEARARMLRILESNGLTGDEFSVASAILLGYDDMMDRELRQKYAGAGALHVLCVSGLHVGIIFLLLSFILKPLNRNKWLRLIQFILMLASIWAYAFITGLSPSVMRAGVMFSLFAWRETRKEKSNPYNILASSAFILLLIDPFMITKIGFQLSFAAVLAIISLFDPLYRLMPVKNPAGDYIWKLTVVSIAAQIGTFPFAIFYFHQFPVYFFITNIIVIPLVWLILNTGILVLLTSLISKFVSMKLSVFLWGLLVGLNKSVEFIDALPGATLSGLVLTIGQVVLIYFVIILITRAVTTRNSHMVVATLSVLILLSGSFLWTRFQKLRQKEIVVYQAGNHTGIDFIAGQAACFVADSALIADQQTISFNISGNRIFSGVRDITSCDLNKMDGISDQPSVPSLKYFGPGFCSFEKKRLAIISDDLPDYQPTKPLHVDLLILSGKPDISMDELQSQFNFETLIFDGVAPWLAQSWESYCDSCGIQYHDVRKDGCFRMQF